MVIGNCPCKYIHPLKSIINIGNGRYKIQRYGHLKNCTVVEKVEVGEDGEGSLSPDFKPKAM